MLACSTQAQHINAVSPVCDVTSCFECQVLDDDTMLEPITLLQLIGTYNSSEPLYIGNILNNFNMGGAGFLLSRFLLQALSAPWTNELLRFTFDENGDPDEPEGLPVQHRGHMHSYNMLDWCIER